MKRLLSFTHWKLQWKFLFIFFVLIILPMLAFSLFIYSQANRAVQIQEINNTRGHLEKIDQNIASITQDIEDISSYMIHSEDIRNFLKIGNAPENRTRLKELEKQINGFATFHLTSKFYLHSISLNSFTDNYMDIGVPIVRDQRTEESWEAKAKELKGKSYWSNNYEIEDSWGRVSNVISLFRVINDINDVTRPLGLVAIRLDAERLYQLINTDFRNLEDMFIVNQNGTVLLPNDHLGPDNTYADSTIIDAIKKNPTEPLTLNYERNDMKFNVVTEPVEGTDLVIVGVVSEASVAEGISPMQRSIRVMMIVLTTFGILALFGFYYFNIRRIKDLATQTSHVEHGDFSANVEVKSKDEIGVLGLSFNNMVKRLKHMIENEYQMEIQNRESELKLLQSQINPHFLYNTLDMIRWTARMEKAFETSMLIEQLSKMFRISLNKGRPWIDLKDELTYTKSYLELQKRRLGNKLIFTVYCDHEALHSLVLKQTIQPLIENSLHHGFENKRILRKIYVRCFKEGDSLVIDVIDNGKGFADGTFSQAFNKGYALQNIKDRLMMMFGEKASITLKEKDTPGAWIRIIQPCIKDVSQIEVAKSEGGSDE
ncbi:sensor histidine kinase [Halobacillus andaensis]|uniref:sensor histidine kinase n=1 Tax=Halobacillus andaensis TaxID=1176239 RepID=UPI003D71E964